MIYLIGTNHELQHNAKPFRIEENSALKARKEFKEYLENLFAIYNIEITAEEFSEEILEMKCTTSTVNEIAKTFDVEHIFCDPNLEERAKIGMPSYGTGDLPEDERLKFHEIREKFWLKKLNDYLGQSILFVCGEEHVNSFKQLLESNGYKATILIDYWGRKYYET